MFIFYLRSRVDVTQRRDPNARMKRLIILLVLVFLGLFTLVIIFMKLGRSSADTDPFLDPMANPNIRVQES